MTKYKRVFIFLVILSLSFFHFLPSNDVHAQTGPGSGTVADYAGTWILEGMTVEDSFWTLDLTADGNYKLHNKYQSYEGKVEFLAAGDDLPPAMILELDPENGIEMFLICTPNTLVDFTQQGLTFVRPGSETTAENENLDITGEFIGDWLFTGVTIYHPAMTMEMSADEIFSLESAGSFRWLINLKDGIVTYTGIRGTSEAASAPVARYRNLGPGSFKYKNPIQNDALKEIVGRITGDKMVLQPFPVGEDLTILLHFVRFTGTELTGEGN